MDIMGLLVLLPADGALLLQKVLQVEFILAWRAEDQVTARLDHDLLASVKAQQAQHFLWDGAHGATVSKGLLSLVPSLDL